MASGITNNDKVIFRIGSGEPTNPPKGSVNIDESSGAMYVAGSSSLIQVKDTTKAPTSHASDSTGFGASSEVNYGHAKASSTSPKALSPSPFAGHETSSFARGDHVHPITLATSSVVGSVRVGSNITVDAAGAISLTKANVTNALGYTPPTTNTTYSVMTGATSSAAGSSGLVPAPSAGKQTSFLRGDGTWTVPPDTNTHYTAKMVATNSATSTTDYISEEPIINNIWLNIVENDVVTSAKNIVADTGMVSVKLLNGKIRISGAELASSNSNVNFPIYFAPDSNPSSGSLSTKYINYNANITLNPSTGVLNGVVIDGGSID